MTKYVSKPIKSNLTGKTFQGVLWLSAGAGFEAILKILVLGVLARLLHPKDFGLVGIALIVVGLSKIITQLGVGPAIVQKENLNNTHVMTGITISVITGIVFSIILFSLSKYIAQFFELRDLENVLKVVSFLFLIEALITVPMALLQRNFQFRWISLISIVSYLFGYGVVSIALAYLGFGFWSLVFGVIAQTLLQLIFYLYKQKTRIRFTLNKKASKELMYFGGGITIARVANYFALQGDNLVVGKLLGANALGIYGRAYTFMVMPVSLFSTALDKALFPAIATIQRDTQKIREIFYRAISCIALIALPISVFVFILSREIISILLGEKWLAAIEPLQLLSLGLLFRMSYKISDSISRAVGAVYRRAWRQFLYAVLIILGCIIGQFWGLEGVCYGVIVALFGNYMVMAHLSISLISGTWKTFFLTQLNGLYAACIVTIALYAVVFLLRASGASSMVVLLIGLTTFLSTFIIIYKMFPIVYGPHGLWFIEYIRSHFTKTLKIKM